MVKKLHLKENAITDLYKWVNNIDLHRLEDKSSGYYDTKYSYGSNKRYRGAFKPSDKSIKTGLLNWIVKTVRNNWDYDFNTEQLNLVPTQKPKGPTIAKKNPNMLIGINSHTGNAVLIGQGNFYEYYSGIMGRSNSSKYNSSGAPEDPNPDWEFKNRRVSLRDTFEGLDLWLEIIPQENYTPRSAIQATRNAELSKVSDWEIDDSDNKYLDKLIYDFEKELYIPRYARNKYASKLKSFKTRKQYENLLNSIDTVNNRIKQINFGHPIFDDIKVDERDISRLRSTYKSLVDNLEKLNKGIDNNDEWDIKWHSQHAEEYLDKINDILETVFNV